MSAHDSIEQQEERSVLLLIQEIKDGILSPKTLSKEVRQQCVKFLCSEGYAETGVARILECSERTIRRDLKEIREHSALVPDVDLAKQIVGDMFLKARTHHAYLMRLARTSSISASDKTQAELGAWRIQKELIEKLQTLGYLPLVPHKISADIFHHEDEEEKTLGELKDELTLIVGIAEKDGILDEEIKEKIQFLQLKIEKTEVEQDIINLSKNHKEDKNEKEDK